MDGGDDDDWCFGDEAGDVVEDCRGFLDFMAIFHTCQTGKNPTKTFKTVAGEEMEVDGEEMVQQQVEETEEIAFGHPEENENPDVEAAEAFDEKDCNRSASPTVKLEQTDAATAAAGSVPVLTLQGAVVFVEDDDESEQQPAAAETGKIHADDVPPPSVPIKELEIPSGPSGDGEEEPKAKTDSEAAINDRALEELQQKTTSRFSEMRVDDGNTSQRVDKLRDQADLVVAAANASASKSEEKQPESVQDRAPTATATATPAETTEADSANDQSGGAGERFKLWRKLVEYVCKV